MKLDQLNKLVTEYSSLVFMCTCLAVVLLICIMFNINLFIEICIVISMLAVYIVMFFKKKELIKELNLIIEQNNINQRPIKKQDIQKIMRLFAQKNLSIKETENELKNILRG